MDNPWIIHGQSMDNPCIIHGFSMDCPWIINPWISMDNPRIIHGPSMDYPWMSTDNPWTSLDFHGLPWVSDYPWIPMGNPWMSGNPFRHQMARHSSWEDFSQTNLDDFSARIFTGLLLVNLGFWNFRFSDVRFSRFVLLEHILEKDVGEISRNKE